MSDPRYELTASSSFQREFFAHEDAATELGDRLGRGVVGCSFVLKELIHGLQGLIVLVEYLKVGDGCRGLVLAIEVPGKLGDGSSANEKHQSEGSGEGGTELASGVEEQTGAKALEPSGRSLGLLLAQEDGKLLIEVCGGFGSFPLIEQSKRSLKRGKLIAAFGAGVDMRAESGVRWCSRIEQKIRKSGF